MKIRKIDIKSFRGIPGEISLLLPDKSGKPCSLLLLGDNGVGKSSVVDSIEFCLQGHISQATSLNLGNIPSIRSFYSFDLPKVSVTFDDDEVFGREVILDGDELLSNSRFPHKAFSISPFVLRRHDILRFIDSSEAERTLVFSNYLRKEGVADWNEHPKDELKRLQDERMKIKGERDALTGKLAKEMNLSDGEIPVDRQEFRLFVQEKIRKGISKKEFEKRGFKVKMNERAISLADDLLIKMEEYNKIRSRIKEFSITNKTDRFPRHLLPQLEDFLAKAGEKLTSSFLTISTHNFIDRVEIKYTNKNVIALGLKVVLKNKRTCSPNQILHLA